MEEGDEKAGVSEETQNRSMGGVIVNSTQEDQSKDSNPEP